MNIEIQENDDGSYHLTGTIDETDYDVNLTGFELMGLLQIHFLKDLL